MSSLYNSFLMETMCAVLIISLHNFNKSVIFCINYIVLYVLLNWENRCNFNSDIIMNAICLNGNSNYYLIEDFIKKKISL